jgi:hypothetical protein
MACAYINRFSEIEQKNHGCTVMLRCWYMACMSSHRGRSEVQIKQLKSATCEFGGTLIGSYGSYEALHMGRLSSSPSRVKKQHSEPWRHRDTGADKGRFDKLTSGKAPGSGHFVQKHRSCLNFLYYAFSHSILR